MDTNEGIGKTSHHCNDKEIIDKKYWICTHAGQTKSMNRLGSPSLLFILQQLISIISFLFQTCSIAFLNCWWELYRCRRILNQFTNVVTEKKNFVVCVYNLMQVIISRGSTVGRNIHNNSIVRLTTKTNLLERDVNTAMVLQNWKTKTKKFGSFTEKMENLVPYSS